MYGRTDIQRNVQTDGHTDKGINRRTYRRMYGHTDECMDRLHADEQTDIRTYGHRVKWTHRQMDKRTDGHMERWTYGQTELLSTSNCTFIPHL